MPDVAGAARAAVGRLGGASAAAARYGDEASGSAVATISKAAMTSLGGWSPRMAACGSPEFACRAGVQDAHSKPPNRFPYRICRAAS